MTKLRAGVVIEPAEGTLVGREVALSVRVQEALVRGVSIGGQDAMIAAGVAKRRLTFTADGRVGIEVRAMHQDLGAEIEVALLVDTRPPEITRSSCAAGNSAEKRVWIRREPEVVRGRLSEGWAAEVVVAGDSPSGYAKQV